MLMLRVESLLFSFFFFFFKYWLVGSKRESATSPISHKNKLEPQLSPDARATARGMCATIDRIKL